MRENNNAIDPATVYEESARIAKQNARLRDLLQKAAKHIDALGDPLSAAMLLEASK